MKYGQTEISNVVYWHKVFPTTGTSFHNSIPRHVYPLSKTKIAKARIYRVQNTAWQSTRLRTALVLGIVNAAINTRYILPKYINDA